MQRLEIEASTSSPYVRFDPDSGELRISGESYPENSHEFYSPLIEWVDRYIAGTTGPVTFIVGLAYLNTSSTKYMIDLLDRLQAAHEGGITVHVYWYCDPDNRRAVDAVEELREDFTMPFAIVTTE